MIAGVKVKGPFVLLPWHRWKAPHTSTSYNCETMTLALDRGYIDEEYAKRCMNPKNLIHYLSAEKELITFDSAKRMVQEESWAPNVMKWKWVQNKSFLNSYAGIKQSLHCKKIREAYRTSSR